MKAGGEEKLKEMIDEGSAICSKYGKIEMVYFPSVRFGTREGAKKSDHISRHKKTDMESFKVLDDMIEKFSWSISCSQSQLQDCICTCTCDIQCNFDKRACHLDMPYVSCAHHDI